MPTTDHHAARDAGAERASAAWLVEFMDRSLWSGKADELFEVVDRLRAVRPLLVAADRAQPASRPEAAPDRAQVLDRYMSLHGATLADRREAERYLAYVLDGPDREGVPPLRGSGEPAPTVEAMLAEMIDRVDEAIEGEFDGLAATKDQAREVLAYVLTGLPPGPERDATLSAALARLAAPADPAPAALAGAVRDAGSFLLDRLEEFGNDDAFSSDGCRDWHGHVWPAVVRFRAALAEGAAGDTAPQSAAKPLMTNAELQAEIGRLQMQLFYRVAGDPSKGVNITAGQPAPPRHGGRP